MRDEVLALRFRHGEALFHLTGFDVSRGAGGGGGASICCIFLHSQGHLLGSEGTGIYELGPKTCQAVRPEIIKERRETGEHKLRLTLLGGEEN